MKLKAALVFGCAAVGLGLESPDPRDLQRARTKVPRAEFKGKTFDSMSDVLNGHMKKMFPKTKPCDEWTAADLQAYQSVLYSYKHDELSAIYSVSSDNRRMNHDSIEKHQQEWSKSNSDVAKMPHMQKMHRDGHCHEAVMWLVHHVPAPEQQTVFARIPAPLLSTTRHSCKPSATDKEKELCKAYANKVTCAECHSGTGMLFQDWKDIPGIIPEDPKYPGMARQRRCDQGYLPKCGPCEGIGGPYWGDGLEHFQATNCELVTKPEDVPVADRQKPEFAEQFIVHQLGSDRLIRTQNAAKFALYSQIRSTLWYDFPLGGESNGTTEDGMAHLRHDTFYDDLLYKWMDNGLVTEIHTQTRAERETNITGPMLSILHGLYGWGKYLGGLTCLADPVGVPVLGSTVDTKGIGYSAFLEGADYLGRIKIGVEYDGFKLGDKGHGDMKAKRNMTVDHYIKWFLHVYVDADKASPTFGQPVRFYGPYSGFAVYVKFDKTAPPANVWTDICPDNGWGESESKPLHPCKGRTIADSKDQIMVVEKVHPEVCAGYLNGTVGDLDVSDGELLKGNFGSIFMPNKAQEVIV